MPNYFGRRKAHRRFQLRRLDEALGSLDQFMKDQRARVARSLQLHRGDSDGLSSQEIKRTCDITRRG